VQIVPAGIWRAHTRYANGKIERLPALVAELIRLNVDLIVAVSRNTVSSPMGPVVSAYANWLWMQWAFREEWPSFPRGSSTNHGGP
jgi:hypothetical protein